MAEPFDMAALPAPHSWRPVTRERVSASFAAAQGEQPCDTDAQFIAMLQASAWRV